MSGSANFAIKFLTVDDRSQKPLNHGTKLFGSKVDCKISTNF